MSKETRPQRELFASPEDVISANQITRDILGAGFNVSYTEFPKSVGAKGDEGVRGHSVVITAINQNQLIRVVEDHEALDRAMGRICAATSATRVLIEVARSEPD
jgi:hypothetical protein